MNINWNNQDSLNGSRTQDLRRDFVTGEVNIYVPLREITKKKPKQQNRLISSFGFCELTENLSVFCNHLLKHQYLLPIQNCLVTPEGLEPPTNRTGICHSIQLNYGALSNYELQFTIFFQNAKIRNSGLLYSTSPGLIIPASFMTTDFYIFDNNKQPKKSSHVRKDQR
jgi:hypothetical protein